MLIPIDVKNFKSLSIGYFRWVCDDKILEVVRFAGEFEDGKLFDHLFKPELTLDKVMVEILKEH